MPPVCARCGHMQTAHWTEGNRPHGVCSHFVSEEQAHEILGDEPIAVTVARNLRERAAKEPEVVHPSHYNVGTIEVWDFIADQGLDFLEGSIVKYVCRSNHKGQRMADLRKIREYAQKLIEIEEAKERNANS